MENRNSFAPAPRSGEGEDVTTWALPEGAIARLGRGSVRDMAFSPNGQHLAVSTAIGFWLYELPTLSPIAFWDTEYGRFGRVSFSPDSRRIVTHTFGENVKIWDIQSGVCVVQTEELNHQDFCQPIFSQDGQRIAAVSYHKNGKIYVWCAQTGTQLSKIEVGETYNIVRHYWFQFSSDTRLLVSRKHDQDSDTESIVVWHVETGEQLSSFTEYSEKMENFCFSPDGSYLAAGSSDGTIRIWDLESGRLATTYTHYGEAQIFPHYTPENELVAAAVSDRNVEVWNIGQNEKLDTFEHRGNSRKAYFSENGTQLAIRTPSEIQIWTKGDSSDTHTLSTLHGHIPTMDTLVFSSDEKTLAAGFWRDNVLLWDVASKHSYRPHGEKLPGTSCNVYCSPDGKIISISVWGSNLNVWEVGKNELLAKLTGLAGRLGRAKAFSSTGHRIASVDTNNSIHIWEQSGSENWKKHTTCINDPEFVTGLVHSLNGLAFSPDGRRLASISRARDCKACLWDIDSGRQIAELCFTLPPERISYHRTYTGIAFSPCGDIIAGGKWGEVVLWDATDGKIRMVLPQPEGNQRPITLCFSPCGRYLLSGSWWQKGLEKVPIRLWEVATGKNIATFWGHTTDVQCFAFSQNGTLLASGGHDGAIYFWDLSPYLK